MGAKPIPIHSDYVDAEVRTFTPCCPLRGRHGISFNVPPYGVLRFAITPESAAFLRLCMDDHHQSPGVGPMGAGQAADAAPVDHSAVSDAVGCSHP